MLKVLLPICKLIFCKRKSNVFPTPVEPLLVLTMVSNDEELTVIAVHALDVLVLPLPILSW
jgi:hypothetical protein